MGLFSQILCFIVMFLFFLCDAGIEPTPSFNSNQVVTQKVALSLYYESLCPYCQSFIVKPLADAVRSDLMSIIDLQLLPWGNAVLLQPNNTIVCQHGEDECYLNTIHACAINIWPDVAKHFELIKCIEEQHSRVAPELSWKACADRLKLPSQSIKDCYDSGYGKQLLLQFGNKTYHLKPPHEYVPWLVVNGTPLRDVSNDFENSCPLFLDYENFVHYVCKEYKGKQIPKACSPHYTSPISKENRVSLTQGSTDPGGD